MSSSAAPDPEQPLLLARAGSRSAPAQLLEMNRNYLTLLARLRRTLEPDHDR
jgi:hypothetical protein